MGELLLIIRQFEADDLPKIHAFFDQMGEESTKFFNTNDVNRQFAVKFVTEKNKSIYELEHLFNIFESYID